MAALSGDREQVSVGKTNEDLLRAAETGDIAEVRLCLAAGVDVNAANKNGTTALMFVARGEHKEIIEMLLKKRADVNAIDGNGATALMSVARSGHKEIVKMLLLAGADVDVASDYGMTALMYVAIIGHKEIVEMLLWKGVDVNAVDEYGKTALMVAVYQGHKEIIEILLYAGAGIGFDWSNEIEERFGRQKGVITVASLLSEIALTKPIVALFAENVPDELRHIVITNKEDAIKHMRSLIRNPRSSYGYVTYMNIVSALQSYADKIGVRADAACEIVNTLQATRPLLWQAAETLTAADKGEECQVFSLQPMLQIMALRQRRTVPRFAKLDVAEEDEVIAAGTKREGRGGLEGQAAAKREHLGRLRGDM